DEKWFLENEKTVTQFCRKLAAERPLKDIRDEYNYPKKKGIKDESSRLLEASTMKSRRGFAIQRLMNAMRQAHARSEERFSRNAETDLVCRLLLEKKKKNNTNRPITLSKDHSHYRQESNSTRVNANHR